MTQKWDENLFPMKIFTHMFMFCVTSEVQKSLTLKTDLVVFQLEEELSGVVEIVGMVSNKGVIMSYTHNMLREDKGIPFGGCRLLLAPPCLSLPRPLLAPPCLSLSRPLRLLCVCRLGAVQRGAEGHPRLPAALPLRSGGQRMRADHRFFVLLVSVGR